MIALVCAVAGLPTPGGAQLPYTIAVQQATRLGDRLRIDVLVDSRTLGGPEVELAAITFPAGGPGRPHRHGTTELLYVLQGELDHTVNGDTRRLSPGMVGIARVGDTVTHRVASAEPVRALVIWAPGGEVDRLMAGMGNGTVVPIASLGSTLEALRALREEWTAAYGAGSVEGLRDLYTGDAVRMPYDAPAQVGRDSVMAHLGRDFARRAFTPAIRLTAAQVEIRDDLAIERGTYDELLTPRTPGRTLQEVGKYVSVARRGTDGRWRYAWGIFNRDGPAAPVQ